MKKHEKAGAKDDVGCLPVADGAANKLKELLAEREADDYTTEDLQRDALAFVRWLEELTECGVGTHNAAVLMGRIIERADGMFRRIRRDRLIDQLRSFVEIELPAWNREIPPVRGR